MNYHNKPYDFSKRPYMSHIAIISFLQRVVILHSLLYYDHNRTIISDTKYDNICKQLVWYMEHTKTERCKRSQYWYCMDDFDGTTGFDIKDRLTANDKEYLDNVAMQLYNSR